MPGGCKKLYPSTQVILDEIFVQTPTSLLLQLQLYSTYKSNATLEGLIGITPNEPFVLFSICIQYVLVMRKSQGVVGF